MTIRVVIADDQSLVRTGFGAILSHEPDLEVVGEAGDGRQAVEQVRLHRPDVVLMDVRMPVMDGLEATRELTASGSATRVLILTTFDLDEYVFAALRGGASGFLLKDAPADQLLTAIRVVAAGDALIAPSVTRRLIAEFAHRPMHTDRPAQLEPLTAREREVLGLLARGMSNSEIAAALFLGEATVKTHVARILSKLCLRDRVQAVVLAYESGLVQPGSATNPA
ncbi:MAG: response regulator [Pseudonocardiaceae bacterium]